MKTQAAALLHSAGTKVVVILLAMASTTAAALMIGNIVTNSMLDHITELAEVEVPAMRDGVTMMTAIVDIRADLADYDLAVDAAELQERHEHVGADLANSLDQIAGMSPQIQGPLKPMLEQMGDRLAASVAAREAVLDRQDAVRRMVQDLIGISARIDVEMVRKQQGAQTALQVLGERSSLSVSRSLGQLTEVEYVSMALVLQTRSDLATLSGIVISHGLGASPGAAEMLQAESLVALDQLAVNIRQIEQNETLKPAAGATADVLRQARVLLSLDMAPAAPIGQTPPAFAASKEALGAFLAEVGQADTALNAVQDGLLVRMSDLTTQAADKNRAAVSALVTSQANYVTKMVGLNTAIKQVTGTVYQAALSTSGADLVAVSKLLADQTAAIEQLMKGQDPATLRMIRSILDLTAADTGIAAGQKAFLAARDHASDVDLDTETFVGASVDAAAEVALQELELMERGSVDRIAEVALARRLFLLVAVISAAILLGVPVLSYLLLVRPLAATARATTRLAQGDMAAVDGLKPTRGEVGAMVAALGVFRDTLAENARLAQEERTNQANRIEAERLAIQQQAAQTAREATQQAEQDQRHRDMEAAEAARRDEMRRVADAERQARETVQATVVAELANGLRRLAQGDLRAKIESMFSEGYDQLRLDFNAAIATLEGVIGSIRTSVDSIHGGSDEISRAAADLSRRTERTAAMLEQSAAALTELTASVESAADGAGEASRIVETARAAAEASGTVVREAVQAMGAIEQSSRKISTIVSVIDDIAFQTNLLALNAGVEAARAGEAGRGFAVVASEVRALSQRSSDAAREIADLISESGRQVNRGVGLVGKTGDALRNIVQSVVEISRHVSTIAASAREQSTGISEINTAIGQLDQSTQQNAAMVEQTNAASLTLADQASQLSRTVAQFSIGEVRADRAAPGDGRWGAERAAATAA